MILTKQDVLDASSKPSYYKADVERLVGSGLMDGLKSVVGDALHKEEGKGMSGGEHADVGAGMSGGGESGGRRRMSRRLLK